MDYGLGLKRSSTIAELGSFIVTPYMNSWAFKVNQGFTDNPIYPDFPRFITNYEKEAVVLLA